ncbi:MAG: glycosyltransferase, partial [bacterium]|nr:glycosyltransferase [bacterium]
MKIAIVHDHLIQDGGAERVLKVLHELYPKAPIYTLVFDKKKLGHVFPPHSVRTSFLQHIPLITKKYQWFLPLMPLATEAYDLSEYDIILSSNSAFSKGVIPKQKTLHICYCHTPTRYLWSDTHAYIQELKKSQIIKSILPFFLTNIRLWDRMAADRVDLFVANSKTVQERIKKYYRRESDVIYPPVETEKFRIAANIGDYYLAGGRLVSYKRFDIVIDAFNRLSLPLKIFGAGPEYVKLKKSAKKNIEFLGAVSDKEKTSLYSHCIAYIHPQEEDFGITAIEAMASGRPVIAFAAGGALETVREGITGEFLIDQDWPALVDVILRFKPEQYNPHAIREHAQTYTTERFKNELSQYISKSWQVW